MIDSKFNKNKILCVTSSFPDNSDDNSGKFVFDLVKKISENKEVFVLAPKKSELCIDHQIDNLKIYYHKQFILDRISIVGKSGIIPNIKKNAYLILFLPFYFFFQFLKIRKIITLENINIINSHWIPNAVIPIIYKKLFNKDLKIILTIHGSDFWVFYKSIFRFFIKIICNNCDYLICVNDSIKKGLDKLRIKTSTAVISMGIDTNLFKPVSEPKERNSILFVGRFIKTKGIIELLSAVNRLFEEGFQFRLILIGKGELLEYAKNFISLNHLEKIITIIQNVPNEQLPKYYNEVELVVLPSYGEGMPLVVMESLSCGTNILTSNIDSLENLKKNGVPIETVDTQDVEKFSDKIKSLLNNQKNNSIYLRNYAVEKFSLIKISEKYSDIINSL